MSDDNLDDIVTQVGKFARQFQAVIDLSEALDSVAKLDQLKSERNTALSAIEAKIAGAQDHLAKLDAQAVARADEWRKQAQEAQARAAQSADEAKEIVAQAKAEAETIVANAQAVVARMQADANAAVLAAQQVEQAAKDRLAEIVAEIEKRKVEGSGLLAQVAETRAQLRRFMGD